MRKSQKCHFTTIKEQKDLENPIFLEKLASSHNPENKPISLTYNIGKFGFWKMRFLAKIRPKLKKGELQRE